MTHDLNNKGKKKVGNLRNKGKKLLGFGGEKIDELIEDNDIKNLIMDFSGVSFMDSSGIGVIMGRYKKIRYADGEIVVIGVNKMIDKIFTMSALYRITRKCDSLQSALEKLNE